MARRTEQAVRARVRLAVVGGAVLALVLGSMPESAGGGGDREGRQAQRAQQSDDTDADREQVVGRVTAVGGTTFTVAGPDGIATTVETSGTTTFVQRAAIDLGDLTVGRFVTAHGNDTDLGFIADLVASRPASTSAASANDRGHSDTEHLVAGTLKSVDLDARTAMVETGNGLDIVVLTPATRVIESGEATMQDVAPGALVRVDGTSADYAVVEADLVRVSAPRTVAVASRWDR